MRMKRINNISFSYKQPMKYYSDKANKGDNKKSMVHLYRTYLFFMLIFSV